jgi:Tol biopolymer transport system component
VSCGRLFRRGSSDDAWEQRLIVYTREAGGSEDLFAIRPDGTENQQLTHGITARNADWSADGQTILFELVRPASAGISVVAADGGDVRVLTPTGYQGQPAFSPDGGSIVYERDIAEGNNGVWLMRANGTNPRRLTRIPFGCCDTDPNFWPNGKTISFVRIKEEERLQALFSIRRDGTGLRQLTPYEWNVAIKHDWSPDGKLIVPTTNADLVRPNASANLVTIRPDGSGMRKLTNFRRRTQRAFAGSFSPDGKQIVFRLETGNRYSVTVVNRDGSNLRRLTTSTSKPRYIDWGTHP